jgi:hypothetical protein
LAYDEGFRATESPFSFFVWLYPATIGLNFAGISPSKGLGANSPVECGQAASGNAQML